MVNFTGPGSVCAYGENFLSTVGGDIISLIPEVPFSKLHPVCMMYRPGDWLFLPSIHPQDLNPFSYEIGGRVIHAVRGALPRGNPYIAFKIAITSHQKTGITEMVELIFRLRMQGDSAEYGAVVNNITDGWGLHCSTLYTFGQPLQLNLVKDLLQGEQILSPKSKELGCELMIRAI